MGVQSKRRVRLGELYDQDVERHQEAHEIKVVLERVPSREAAV